jgi:hypothetical protein
LFESVTPDETAPVVFVADGPPVIVTLNPFVLALLAGVAAALAASRDTNEPLSVEL